MAQRVVAAEVPAITLEEILAIKHPDPAVWSPDGRWLAWRWDDGGVVSLWAAPDGGAPVRISGDEGEASVSGFSWSPDGRLAYAHARGLWLARPGEEPRRLSAEPADYGSPRWAPNGDALAYTRDGSLVVRELDSGQERKLAVPGKVIAGYADSVSLAWSPGGSKLAAIVQDASKPQRDVAVVGRGGELVWRSDTPHNESAFAWVDDERLHVTRMDPSHTVRTHHLVDPTTGQERELLREESRRGLKGELAPVIAPDGQSVVYVLTPENWPHLFQYQLDSGELRQLTFGDCDDTGHAGDFYSFSPDSERIVYCSSRDTALNQRRLWVVDVARAESTLLTPGPGTDSCAAWSPDGARIAYQHCGPDESADIWTIAPDDGEPRQISRSMPATLSPERLTRPQHLTYPSLDGLPVHADLFLPRGFDESRRHHYPAVVWVHGGMARQMRDGWHPMHSYALFYSYHQYLLHRGFVVLSVDYRGSIGYGRDYQEGTYLSMLQGDLADVVAGADFLRTLPYIDPEAIGVYGLSYGGYLTLGALTKHPDAFALGINIAGIWDWPQYEAWREATYPGSNWGSRARLGGPETEANVEVWRQASPKHWVDGLRAPLLNLMGTKDERVDFAQLDVIIRDCVAHEKDFAVMYYPGETHTFTYRRTWRDAFPRLERAFQRYLTVPQDERPRAMI